MSKKRVRHRSRMMSISVDPFTRTVKFLAVAVEEKITKLLLNMCTLASEVCASHQTHCLDLLCAFLIKTLGQDIRRISFLNHR